MMQFLNYRMKITLTDLRTIIGTFLAYDKHMNLVLVRAHLPPHSRLSLCLSLWHYTHSNHSSVHVWPSSTG